MSYCSTVNANTIRQWVAERLDAQKIQEELHAAGCDDVTIAAHLKEFKRLKYAKRQFTGFIYLGLGAFLGFISCLLTMINPVPELYNWILYGLTSIAMCILFIGLYYVFE
jgi:hypothetical protein